MEQHTGAPELSLRFSLATDLLTGTPKLTEDIDGRPESPEQSTLDFVDTLIAGETPEEALAVCAYALPSRHAVWWGHECLNKISDLLTEIDLQYMQLAAAWVSDPSEENRAAAVEAAYPGDNPPLPGQWIALGAGWSEGRSMNPSALPEVPPADHLSPTAINAGVLTALAFVDVEHREATINSFVKMARQLATAS